MSRNVRQKFPRPPAKTSKRRGSDSSSSLDLSSDDGYSGVDDISDSEDDDEENVVAAEEEHIIHRELHPKDDVLGSPRPGQNNDEVADDEYGDGDEEDNEDVEAVDDEDEEDDEDADDSASASWDGILSDIDDSGASDPHANNYILDQDDSTFERHVRFVGVPDSDSDSTDSETTGDIEEFFPDIFVAQESLDNNFRREIEEDPDDSSNSGSYWDFHSAYGNFAADSELEDVFQQACDDDTPVATPAPSQGTAEVSTPVASADEGHELDGYETDGDTTEEDVPEPPVVRKKQFRRSQQLADESESDTDRTVRFRRGKPRVGRFNLDSSEKKPICVVNPISRKMMIFTPQRLRRLDLSPESFNFDFFTNPDTTQSSPILSNSASLMMGAMFSSNTFGDFMNTQAVGPAEAFFSLPSDAVTGDGSDESEVDDPEDEEERNLKLEDFITFEEHSSDEEQDDEVNWLEDASIASSPIRRPSTAASGMSETNMEAHPLLSHFENNANAVGAFRRNQINQQLIFSDKATQESLAFSSPYHHGTLRGIKNGSLETVTTPITPARRQKKSVNGLNPVNEYSRSPLETMSQKRKASAGVGEGMSNHKRQRSISDVKVLKI